jgi:hypothetical protein
LWSWSVEDTGPIAAAVFYSGCHGGGCVSLISLGDDDGDGRTSWRSFLGKASRRR